MSKRGKNTKPQIFSNTDATLLTVPANRLEEGKTYLIQHNNEGSYNGYVTRLKGTFVEINVGRSRKYPTGIIGHITPSREVAVFENVKIISSPSKTLFTNDIYVIKPINNKPVAFDTVTMDLINKDPGTNEYPMYGSNYNYSDDEEGNNEEGDDGEGNDGEYKLDLNMDKNAMMRTMIEQYKNVAFAVTAWSFSESRKEEYEEKKFQFVKENYKLPDDFMDRTSEWFFEKPKTNVGGVKRRTRKNGKIFKKSTKKLKKNKRTKKNKK